MSGKNYSHQLDAKNRMRIPAKLREELGENYSITVGTGGCLYVYTEEQMKEVEEAIIISFGLSCHNILHLSGLQSHPEFHNSSHIYKPLSLVLRETPSCQHR